MQLSTVIGDKTYLMRITKYLMNFFQEKIDVMMLLPLSSRCFPLLPFCLVEFYILYTLLLKNSVKTILNTHVKQALLSDIKDIGISDDMFWKGPKRVLWGYACWSLISS